MIKLDLHTHSIISPDGGIDADQYEALLKEGIIDCVAITDHNETTFAKDLHNKLGEKVIVGEEIMTRDGEMIGLFLKKTIPSALSAKETLERIHDQEGLVYIPHPFEIFRKGIQKEVVLQIISEVDIFETFNGRGAVRGKTKEAQEFGVEHGLVGAASSDAHGYYGIGRTFSIINELPTKATLKKLLQTGNLQKKYAPMMSYLYPFLNRLNNKLISNN